MLVTEQKEAKTDHPIHKLLRTRWSPRAFANLPVDDETLARLFEAARWSASSRNEQPWRFLVLKQENRGEFGKLVETLSEGNRRWAQRAPVLILVVAKKTFANNGKANHYALYDVGQAMAHLSIQATAEGLHLHQMAGFSKDGAREAFSLPEDHDPVVTVALGYLGDPASLSDELAQRERAERKRKPLSDLVFSGQWDEPLFPAAE